jgi:hypothetical protein
MEMERIFNPFASGSKPPGSSIMDLCPQRPRERILNPQRKHRRFESDQVLHIQFALKARPSAPNGSVTHLDEAAALSMR